MPGEDGCFVCSKERLLLPTSFVCFACGKVILLAAPHSAAVAAAPAVAVTFVVISTIAVVDEVSLHCIIPQLAKTAT